VNKPYFLLPYLTIPYLFFLRDKIQVLCIILGFFILGFNVVLAQPRVFRDMNKYIAEKPKFMFSFDGQNTYVEGKDARFFGLKTGIDFKGRVHAGVGLYGLRTYLDRSILLGPDTITGKYDTLPGTLKFSYITSFIEYVFFQTKHWEFKVPFAFGLGGSSYTYYFTPNVATDFRKGGVLLMVSGLGVEYKFTSWVGLGAGVGYRQILIRNRLMKDRLSTPYYSLAVKLYFGKLYRYVFPKKDKR
jgi:hypothetical protein